MKFETHFRCFAESLGGSEQGSRLCFADVANWGLITSATQALSYERRQGFAKGVGYLILHKFSAVSSFTEIINVVSVVVAYLVYIVRDHTCCSVESKLFSNIVTEIFFPVFEAIESIFPRREGV